MSFGGYLKANTAATRKIGPFLDSTDGNTNETGLSIAQADIRVSKNGGNLAQINDNQGGGNLTHDELGYYDVDYDTTDTNTEGSLKVIVHKAGALLVETEYIVLSEAAYDSLMAAKDAGYMDVNIKTIGRSDTQETEASNLESACSNYSVTRGLAGTALPAVAADGAGGLPISDAGGLDMDAILADTNEIQGKLPTNNIMGSSDTDNHDTDIDAILVDTNEIQGKLPTDYIMGSSDVDDHDTDIDAILADTNEIQGKLPTNNIMGSSDINDHDTDIDAILADTNEIQGKLPTGYLMGSSDTANHDTDIDSILTDTNEIQGKLPTNYIMGSSDVANHDTDIDSILADTNEIQGKLPSKTYLAGSSDADGGIDSTEAAVIATQVNNSIEGYNLDHLCKNATAAADMTTEVADNTILSRMLANGDTSAFDPSTDGLQLIRDRGDSAWISGGIKKNVALNYFKFKMVLSSDHKTPATGKTVTATICLDNGAYAACTNSVSEISGGTYMISFTQAELNADNIALRFTETDCDQVDVYIITEA